jgi:hypothetical protein
MMTKKKALFIFLWVLASVVYAGASFSLDTADIITLKKAGLGDGVIQAVMDEKAVETCAFSVNEIVEMKKAGMSDQTIIGIIKKGSFTKDAQPVIYGTETKSLKSLTPKDLIALKNAGISDEVLDSIVKGSYDNNDLEQRRAWSMLENMGLIVDGGLRR